ncbi:2-C-methyl-D-erythritol 4-phosphate cytidylyltransferase [Moraxella macacae 0408225]|uniref:2-C-methyl-D-erythritol 4-phosphate cytidylyltransferase n=1 Tax=Moraxella macacae 0408225 TaxID=1230338 RepID=L2F7Y8_9GAMM|nr:2-C-methyl-D-erythritol 4-phosphate cytidylyltransferase [Moraxella macacae]ELA08901.1 2-C-methyl-D-erythritol 4-phosphate cytidylyltransferase [Moraxella macacae 0408225]
MMQNIAKKNIIHTIVVAAGAGKRFGANIPKQYCQIHGKTVLEHTVSALSQVSVIDSCYLVVAADDGWAKSLNFELPIHWVVGGAERMHSVYHGVCAVAKDVQNATIDLQSHWVLIHDAGRPCVNPKDIENLIHTVCDKNYQSGGLLATPIKDTVKQHRLVQNFQNQCLVSEKTLDRSVLWLAQTPQLFPLTDLYAFLTRAIEDSIAFTDEASLFEYFGKKPLLVAGSQQNIKLTFAEDLQFAEVFLSKNFCKNSFVG